MYSRERLKDVFVGFVQKKSGTTIKKDKRLNRMLLIEILLHILVLALLILIIMQ